MTPPPRTRAGDRTRACMRLFVWNDTKSRLVSSLRDSRRDPRLVRRSLTDARDMTRHESSSRVRVASFVVLASVIVLTLGRASPVFGFQLFPRRDADGGSAPTSPPSHDTRNVANVVRALVQSLDACAPRVEGSVSSTRRPPRLSPACPTGGGLPRGGGSTPRASGVLTP